jgi:hypothetical protein
MRLTLDAPVSHSNQPSLLHLLEALKDQNDDVRQCAAMMMGKSRAQREQRIEPLTERVRNDSSTEVRLTAMKSLSELEVNDERNVSKLTQTLLEESDPVVQAAIYNALRQKPSATVFKNVLVRTLCNERLPAKVRIRAANVLGEMELAALSELGDALIKVEAAEVRRNVAKVVVRLAMAVKEAGDAIDADLSHSLLAKLKAAHSNEKNHAVFDLVEVALYVLIRPPHPRKDVALTPKPDYIPRESKEGEGLKEEQRTNPPDSPSIWQARIKAIVEDSSPRDWPAAASQGKELLSLAKRLVAHRLAVPLNARLQKQPQDSYQEKQEIVSWVNKELRELGLAIRCPRTGRPAILVADFRDNADDSSRFRFESRNDDNRRTRTFSGNHLTDLVLIEDELRPEPFAKKSPGRK